MDREAEGKINSWSPARPRRSDQTQPAPFLHCTQTGNLMASLIASITAIIISIFSVFILAEALLEALSRTIKCKN